MSKQKTSLVPLISTIIVAVLAIILAVVAVILMTSGNNNNETSNSTPDSSVVQEEFRPTQELVDQCTYAAHDLVAGNYKIVGLFITNGLPRYDEPYGNKPEDGLYTVNSSEYTSLKQIEDLVKSIYTEQEANRILTNVDGNGLAVYQNREVLVLVEEPVSETAEADSSPKYETEYVLGISENFVPATDYTKDWSSVRIGVVPVTAEECKLTIYLDGVDPETADVNSDSVLSLSMVKTENGWRLTKFVY